MRWLCVLALVACGSASPPVVATTPQHPVVIRLSRGSFAPDQYQAIRAKLDASQQTLVPAIRNLRGCLHYWAAIDPVSNTLINVSVWQTLDDAKQMETLGPMLALAKEFVDAGVTFERPITNSGSLWSVK